MITIEEQLATVLAPLVALPPRREPLPACFGLLLAEDLPARFPVPPFDNSAMDGFAVRAADVAGAAPDAPVRLTVVGDIPAGTARLPQVGPGTAARIMTGSPLPPGADALVPVEQTDQPAGATALPQVVEIHQPPAPAAHIRRAAEDINPGDVVLRAGVTLHAAQLSAAASAGYGDLLVRPRLRVGVLSTGDELIAPGEELGPGQIPDSNTVLLTGLVRQAGGEPVILGPVGDEPAELARVVAEALPRLDALVSSGGVSAGTRDVIKAALTDDLTFTRVAMQPGKPQGFGMLDDRVPMFALPGNPVSVLVSFHVYVVPGLRRLLDLPVAPPPVQAIAGTDWRCPVGRRQYIPVRYDGQRDGLPRVVPAAPGGSGSHLVGSLAAAEALAVVAADVEAVTAGDRVGLLTWS